VQEGEKFSPKFYLTKERFGMTKWTVSGTLTFGVEMDDIEADSKEDAIEIFKREWVHEDLSEKEFDLDKKTIDAEANKQYDWVDISVPTHWCWEGVISPLAGKRIHVKINSVSPRLGEINNEELYALVGKFSQYYSDKQENDSKQSEREFDRSTGKNNFWRSE